MRTALVGMAAVGAASRNDRTLWYAQDDYWRGPRGRATLAIAGVAPAGPAVFGTGRLLEAATTNRITNPSFETGVAGWTTNNATIAQDASAAVFGGYGAKIQATAADARHNVEVGGIAVSAGDVVSCSIYARKGAGADWARFGELNDSGAHAVWFNLASGAIGSTNGTVDSATITAIGNGVYRLTITATRAAAGNAIFYYELVQADGQISFNAAGTEHHYVDGAQFEKNAAATSYADGSLGAGYAWTGAAHASTSTRAASQVVGAAAALAPVAGGACAWLRPSWPGASAAEHVLWHWRAAAGRELLLRHVAGEWRLEASGAGQGATAATPAVHTAGGTAFVWAAWNASVLTVGTAATAATAARAGAITTPAAATLRLGARADSGSGALDAALDTLLLTEHPLRADAARAFARLTRRPRLGDPE